jgi:copper(I)-binding protein
MKNVAAVLLFLVSGISLAGDIVVEDAWIQDAPPAAKVMAAYMRIVNRSDSAVTVEAVKSDRFGAVDIHATEVHHGMAAHMSKRKVRIGPGESFIFEPGGHHLMLQKAKGAVRVGDTVAFMVYFDNGSILEAVAVVRGRDADMTGSAAR